MKNNQQFNRNRKGYNYLLLVGVSLILVLTNISILFTETEINSSPKSAVIYSAGFVNSFGTEGTGVGELSNPYGIAINSSDYVFVVDYLNDKVLTFSPAGDFVREFGGSGSGDGEFKYPKAVALNQSDYIFVIEEDFNNRIQIFTPAGEYHSQIPVPGERLAISPAGQIYVEDEDIIEVYSPTGEFQFSFGNNGTAEENLVDSHGFAINATGYVYVSDIGNDTIKVYSPTGDYQFQFVDPYQNFFDYCYSLAFDESGILYAGIQHWSNIALFTMSGEYLGSITEKGEEEGQNNYIEGIAINSTGHILVVNRENHNVNAFVLERTPEPPVLISTIANSTNNGEIFINWNEEPGAVSYKIYRSSERIYELLGNETVVGTPLTNNTFVDTIQLNGTYNYVVTAMLDGKESEISNCKGVWAGITEIPEEKKGIPGFATSLLLFITSGSILGVITLLKLKFRTV